MKRRELACALLVLAFAGIPRGYAEKGSDGAWVVTAPEMLKRAQSIAMFAGIIEPQKEAHNAAIRGMITEELQDISLSAAEATLTRYQGFLVKGPQQVRILYGTSSLPLPAPFSFQGSFVEANLKDCSIQIAQKIRKKLRVDSFIVFHVVFWSAQMGEVVEYTSGTRGLEDDVAGIFKKRWLPPKNENMVAVICQVFDSGTGKQIAFARQTKSYDAEMLLLSQTAWRNAAGLAAELVSLKTEVDK